MITPKHIVVAIDFSPTSEVALTYGLNFARNYAATLHLVHVVDDLAARVVPTAMIAADFGRIQTELEQDARAKLAAIVAREGATDLKVNTVVRTSATAAQTILEFAAECRADLIIVGTHGRTGMSHLLLGSVAERIVRSAFCPVLTVRHQEREFVRPDALQATARAR